MSIVRRRAAKCVVHKRLRKKRAIRQVLEPAATTLVAHKQIKLSVRPELQDAAVVIGLLRRIGRAGMPWRCHIVGLPRAQLDQVLVQSQS